MENELIGKIVQHKQTRKIGRISQVHLGFPTPFLPVEVTYPNGEKETIPILLLDELEITPISGSIPTNSLLTKIVESCPGADTMNFFSEEREL